MTVFPPVNQIALSVVDLALTERWFREGLGFLPAGGTRLMTSSPLAALIQGLPKAASTCWWLVGRNPWCQLELFQFCRPVARLMAHDARPSDIGYTRIGVWVADFDAALGRLAALETTPLAAVQGGPGRRRACVRNPDGVFVELMEEDPLPSAVAGERTDCPVAVRSVTLSTPDLPATVAYLTALSGRPQAALSLHGDEHEGLWGLPGAKCRRAVFQCGDVLVEAVQYLEPLGRPWPEGYRICDQGILNIAFGSRNRRDHGEIFRRARAHGARANARPIHLPGAGVVYVNDALGFSVEILWMAPGKAERQWGFQPLPPEKRPRADTHRVEASVIVEAPPDLVWTLLKEQERMSHWSGFRVAGLAREGHPDRDGRGSERVMKGPGGTVVEQVTELVEKRRIRYRVIAGSPFVYHQGEVLLRPAGAGTEVTWSIRFRARAPLPGALARPLLRGLLEKMLVRGFKPYAEGISRLPAVP